MKSYMRDSPVSITAPLCKLNAVCVLCHLKYFPPNTHSDTDTDTLTHTHTRSHTHTHFNLAYSGFEYGVGYHSCEGNHRQIVAGHYTDLVKH